MGNLGLLTYMAAVNCRTTFLGLLPWNTYLSVDPKTCDVTNFHVLGSDSSILLILLVVIDDLFRIAGLLAVIFIIYAGTKFILSQGSPDEAAKARTAGISALVGLGISLVAISFVSFLGAQFGNQRGAVSGLLDLSSLPNPAGVAHGDVIVTALGIVFGILGAVAFLIIVIAGMQYVFSQGDPQATSRSKSAIIYALIGLIIALVAQSVVSFAVSRQP